MTTTPIPRSDPPRGPLAAVLVALQALIDHLALAAGSSVPVGTGDTVAVAEQHLRVIGSWQAADARPVFPVAALEDRLQDLPDLFQQHRRVLNVRACSGCSWKPERPGYASNPEDTRRRHAQFNEHLANETARLLLGGHDG